MRRICREQRRHHQSAAILAEAEIHGLFPMLFEGERIMHIETVQHIVSLLDDVLGLTYDIRATEESESVAYRGIAIS
jgi:hypothetical protein